jgi:hypothetical protein
MPKFDRKTSRRIRLFEALQGRRVDQLYRFDADLRRDLAQEAAYGAEDPDNALLTPEIFADLRAVAAWSRNKERVRPAFGAPPSTTSDVGGATTYRARRTGHIFLPMAAKVIVAILDILRGRKVKLPKVKAHRRAHAKRHK